MIRTTLRALVALLLLVSQSFAAMTFNGSSEYAKNAALTVPVTGPFTMCCWGNASNDTNFNVAIALVDGTTAPTSSADVYRLAWRGSTDTIQFDASDRGESANAANSSGTWSPNVWHHACGVHVQSASVFAYLDGVQSAEGTTGATPDNIDTTSIGGSGVSTPESHFGGALAECALWSVALSAAEVGALAKGFAPPCVRTDRLVDHWPALRDSGSLLDRYESRNNLTLTGGTVSDHPPIMYCD